MNKIRRSLPVILLLAVIGVVGIIPSDQAAAYTSGATINSVLPGGQSTIVWVEADAQARNSNPGCPNTRAGLNSCGAPYWSTVWVSPRSQPTAGSQATLPSTTRTVPLQLNSFYFLTAATSGRNAGSTAGLGTIRYNAGTAANMVTNANYPNDRLPASSPSINVASLKASRNKIYSAAVVAGGGSLSNVPVGSIYGTTTSTSSRYSIGPVLNFDYNSGAWVGLQRTVTIRFSVATISTFHAAPPGGTSQCQRGGRTVTVNSNAFDTCDRGNVDYTFTFYVVPVWNLEPSISLSGTESAFSGETITTSPTVRNVAEGASSGTNWVVSTMTYPAGSTTPTAATTSDNYGQTTANMGRPCAHFAAGGASNCRTESSGTGNYNPGNNTLPNVNAIVGEYPLGTKVCYTLSVWSKDNTDLNRANQIWAHSAPACLIIARSPNVQILGGDLKVGQRFADVTGTVPAASAQGHISTRTVSGEQRTFGSWIEYGMFTTNRAVGVASGSAFAGTGLDAHTTCRANPITFANTATANACASGDTVGLFDYKGATIPNVAAQFPVTASTPVIGGGDLNDQSKRGTFTASGNVSLGGGVLAPGRVVVINAPNATVTLTGDIAYADGPYSSILELPQLIIIARNIIIDDSVGRIDAWLIAKGSVMGTDGKINTCASVGETNPLTATVCTTPLTINGPVMSQQLFLRRTAGAGTADPGSAAETINLRADAYLWGVAHNANSGRLTTVYETELPPRF